MLQPMTSLAERRRERKLRTTRSMGLKGYLAPRDITYSPPPNTLPYEVIPDPLWFVYIYWDGGAQGDELRWSMRSVQTNYQGNCEFLVVGDPPSWYRGPCIHMERTGPCYDRRYRDTLNKIRMACSYHLRTNTDNIPQDFLDQDTFVWMMDDIYYLQPVDYQQLRVHRYRDSLSSEKPPEGPHIHFRNQKWRSTVALERCGLQTMDWCTHLPHVIRKDKWNHVWEKYRLEQQVLSWEICYGGEFQWQGVEHRGFYQRVPEPFEEPTGIIVSNGDAGWSYGLREYLKGRFPNPSKYEHDTNIDNIFNQFGVSKEYRSRPANNTGIPTPKEAQMNVYTYARGVASVANCERVVDIGCGDGYKLIYLFGDMDTLGIDVTEKIRQLQSVYPHRNWEDVNEENPISTDLLLCVDVIEHLDNPLLLLQRIDDAQWSHLIISTPERDLVPDNPKQGPPKNPRHTREWNQLEFEMLLREHVGAGSYKLQVMGQYNLVAHLTRIR